MAEVNTDPPQPAPRHSVDWGNAPQWVSAVCAFALAALAIYGLFFSKASQVLVSYLQSELAVRNQRIAALELREQQLQLSIATAQNNLNGLAERKDELESQLSSLKAQYETASKRMQQLNSTLVNTEFFLVREKIGAKVSSVISELMVLTIKLSEELTSPQGTRARTVKPWDYSLKFVQDTSAELPESDRILGRIVVEKFIQQCARYNEVVIQIPNLRIPRDADMSPYNYNSDKHPASVRLEAIRKQIEKAENDIEACFKTVAP